MDVFMNTNTLVNLFLSVFMDITNLARHEQVRRPTPQQGTLDWDQDHTVPTYSAVGYSSRKIVYVLNTDKL